jgi:hypothetical protein
MLTLLSSWATCGFEKAAEKDGNKYGMDPAEKERVGTACKITLDRARRDFLRAKYPAFSVDIEQYCTLDTSPECRIIIMA